MNFFSQRIALFQSLSPEQSDWLEARTVQKTLTDKSILYQPGDVADEVFFLLSGRVKTEVFHDEGKAFIRRMVLKGEPFGEHALFGENIRPEYACPIITPVKMLVFRANDLAFLFRENFDFREAWLHAISRQITRAEQRILAFSAQQARHRIVDFLKELVQTQGQRIGYEWLVRHNLTQEEIGSYTGTGRQAVTEIFGRFKQENVIHYSRGKILIRDLSKLTYD
ncbi:MAG: Crp/Fnr family transcriptional regulator [Bacteroidetes bacterium]|nr:MAG: Crp/Fnr family transcriptional regulator [Bacteroidota bacterium]